MAEETNFIPRKVTNPNDFLDRKSYLCICNVFCNSRAITDEISRLHDIATITRLGLHLHDIPHDYTILDLSKIKYH